jgi:hypothetical protein
MNRSVFYTLLYVCFFASVADGQNYLRELYHPFFEQLIPLRTDSMFIVQEPSNGQKSILAIGYDYEKGLLKTTREKYSLEKNQINYFEVNLWNGIGESEQMVETYKYDSIYKYQARSRTVKFLKDNTHIDSIHFETYQDKKWVILQKNIFERTPSGSVKNEDIFKLNLTNLIWEKCSRNQYEYDNAGRTTQRMTYSYNQDESVFRNEYNYTFKSGKLPITENWYSGDLKNIHQVDSTKYWFDTDEKYDSAYFFVWIASLDKWIVKEKYYYNSFEQKKSLVHDVKKYDFEKDVWYDYIKNEYLKGEQFYTDEPAELMVQSFNALSNEWVIQERHTINYENLKSDKLLATYKKEALNNQTLQWETVLTAQAWLRLNPDELQKDTIEIRANQLKFSYICGMPNPYIANQTVEFPVNTDVKGEYALRILSSDGRVMYSEQFTETGLGFVDAVLPPGFYIAFVTKGDMPICSQKLIVH